MLTSGDLISTPLTLSTVSEIRSSKYVGRPSTWHNHVRLPGIRFVNHCTSSANCLAKLANGLCDEMLYALYLSATCPVIVAPAMDLDMWKHSSVQRNVAQLAQDGVHVLEPATGFLASGLEGQGRLPDAEVITAFAEDVLGQSTQAS